MVKALHEDGVKFESVIISGQMQFFFKLSRR